MKKLLVLMLVAMLVLPCLVTACGPNEEPEVTVFSSFSLLIVFFFVVRDINILCHYISYQKV